MTSYCINKEDSISFNANWINFYKKTWRGSSDGNSYAIVRNKDSLDFNFHPNSQKNEIIDFSTSFKILSNGYAETVKGFLFDIVDKKEFEIIPQPEENNKIFFIKTYHKDTAIKIHPNINYPDGYHFYAVHAKHEKHFNVFFNYNYPDLIIHVSKMVKRGGNYVSKTCEKNNNKKIILFAWEMIHVTRLSKNEWIIDNGFVYEEGI